MEEIKLRNAQNEDFDFIWNLYSNSIKPLFEGKFIEIWDDEIQKKQFKEIYSINDTRIILNNGSVVGWIDFRENDRKLNLVNGFILPSERKKGIMSFILNSLLPGKNEIIASTIVNNPYNAFLDKFGFQTFEKDNFTELKKLIK